MSNSFIGGDMEKTDARRLKAMLTLADADIKACRAMIRLPETVNEERLI